MLFSIVTVCKNNLAGIKNTVESVKNQTMNDYEHILVDGDSSDGTKEYVLGIIGGNCRGISEKDNGISQAFNKGLAMANGDYVLFLNSGDVFTSKDVLTGVSEDIRVKEYDVMIYAAYHDGHTLPENIDVNLENEYWHTAKVPHQTTFVKRTVFDAIGGFDENLRLRMDYDFFYRCVKENISHKYFPKVIVRYESGGACSENMLLFGLEGCEVQYRYEDDISDITMKDFISAYKDKHHAFELVDIARFDEVYGFWQKSNGVLNLLSKVVSWGYPDNRLEKYLLDEGILHVAIYGNGYVGNAVRRILFCSAQIKIDYVVDKYAYEIGVVSFEDDWDRVDALLVTISEGIDEALDQIKEKTSDRVIVLKELDIGD